MSGWILWALVALGFGVGEMLTMSFFLAPFSLGGGVAALTDAAGAGELATWIVFVAVSVLSLALLRPLVRSRLMQAPPIRTGAAALIGRRAVVLERIDDHHGCVRIDGEVWSARSLDEDREIEPGTRVEVVDIKGATALVME